MEQEPLLIPDPASNIHDTLFQDVFGKQDVIMLLIDPQVGRIVDANQAAGRFYGYELSRLKAMSISEIRYQSPVHEDVDSFIQQHKLADGEIRTVEVRSSPVIVNGNSVLFSIVHDITEYKQAENEYARLLQSEQ